MPARSHFLCDTTEYVAWKRIQSVCNNSKHRDYHKYGGRGIKVCERWTGSFENFLSDMGYKPSPNLSLDRINVNGNYEPSNCRWADATTQQNNLRRNVFLEYKGERKTLSQWAKFLGLKMACFRYRYVSGFTEERLFSKEKLNNNY